MKPVVVIPSYWGRPRREGFHREDDVYDHPTPLDEEGTLARALESFKGQEETSFRIVVIGVAANRAFRDACRAKLTNIIDRFKGDFELSLFSYDEVEKTREALTAKGLGDAAQLVRLEGYSPVRNACALATALAGSDTAIFFDDDEIVTDPAFISKATEHIGRIHEGKRVLAVAGYYERAESSGYLAPEETGAMAAVWPSTASMNAAFRLIGEEPRLKKTPFVFGGNMVVHRDLYSKIPFDPNVPRGEDIDFLINAKMFGHDFLLDNELFIKHLPPPKSAPKWRRFREDVRRFSYTKQKLESQREERGLRRVEVDELKPYPGDFLDKDLPDKIFQAATLMALEYLAAEDKLGYEESIQNIAAGWRPFAGKETPFDWYLGYQKEWERLMEAVESFEPGLVLD